MNNIKCCLSTKCKAEHGKATNRLYTDKLYQVGKLFDSKPICVWCLLHLQELTKVPLNENDCHLEDLKEKFPGYWKIIQSEGIDKVRSELGRTWLELEPDVPPKAEPTVSQYVGHRDL